MILASSNVQRRYRPTPILGQVTAVKRPNADGYLKESHLIASLIVGEGGLPYLGLEVGHDLGAEPFELL